MEERQVRNNEVFGGAREVPMISTQEATGIVIPTAQVPVPSRGLVYPPNSPLYLQESVDIKGMTTVEEDILMSRALIKKGTVITELIRSCLLNKNVSVNDLLSGDRNALMVAIRITGYGSEYAPKVKCPSCEADQDWSVNLSDLAIKNLEIDPAIPGENRFKFLLPVMKKNVEFKFLTGKDEEEIIAASENKKKRGIAIDNVVSTRLFYSILSVDGETDRSKLAMIIKSMQAQDSRALRTYIDKHEPGIDMKHPFECTACGHTEEVLVPLGASFFWPST